MGWETSELLSIVFVKILLIIWRLAPLALPFRLSPQKGLTTQYFLNSALFLLEKNIQKVWPKLGWIFFFQNNLLYVYWCKLVCNSFYSFCVYSIQYFLHWFWLHMTTVFKSLLCSGNLKTNISLVIFQRECPVFLVVGSGEAEGRTCGEDRTREMLQTLHRASLPGRNAADSGSWDSTHQPSHHCEFTLLKNNAIKWCLGGGRVNKNYIREFK